ncbi:hypothetical protein NM688_g1630 [Phlebia brevispora]|uniref:Uncharacterized protein n=1 Tax=Phlebia brevispora TaxID=194682 RepID=A0ACC1TB86_9APHY|nr:hypothetical protein NM688_g1630 [Phlebia brevispora]
MEGSRSLRVPPSQKWLLDNLFNPAKDLLTDTLHLQLSLHSVAREGLGGSAMLKYRQVKWEGHKRPSAFDPRTTQIMSFFSLPHVEPSPKRVRVLFNGEYIVDTKNAKLGWIKPYYPYYFFETKDVPNKYLVKARSSSQDKVYDLVVADRKAEAAVSEYVEGELKGLVLIDFGAPDAWFEEDEQIFVHPKDIYKRVDVLQSSRHVRIELNGVEIANTTKPRLLFETSLPVRTYIPKTDCRLDFLVPSELTTQCPYKGVANYYHVRLLDGTISEDSVWWYRTPQLECAEVKGFLAFYDNKFDVYVDGELQSRK